MNDLFSVEGRTVLVTGGSRGIGKMIAEGFVANGARVYISSRRADACEATAAELSQLGECIALPANASTAEGWEQLSSHLAGAEGRLDILVNNAGASWGAPLEEYPEDGWDKVLDLNLRGAFFLTQRLLPLLRASTFAPARIINIASINGLQPPGLETYAYSAAKAGLIMLTRHLAKRLAGEKILVNAIAPGPFATDMMAGTLARKEDEYLARNPLGRLGTKEDIAGTALFLSSRASAYMTGAVVPCDGGDAEV